MGSKGSGDSKVEVDEIRVQGSESIIVDHIQWKGSTGQKDLDDLLVPSRREDATQRSGVVFWGLGSRSTSSPWTIGSLNISRISLECDPHQRCRDVLQNLQRRERRVFPLITLTSILSPSTRRTSTISLDPSIAIPVQIRISRVVPMEFRLDPFLRRIRMKLRKESETCTTEEDPVRSHPADRGWSHSQEGGDPQFL